MSTVSALRDECADVSRALTEIDEAEFDGPTRCPAWSVKELLAHMYRDIDNVSVYLAEPEPSEATHDSVSYWNYDAAKMAPGVADRAKALAATFSTSGELVEAWNRRWPQICDLADATDPQRLVMTWGPAMNVEEYLRTRVLEIVVHHLDLEDAFGRICWGTDEAVGIVDEILVDLLGKEPPHELEWDAIEFIERATGRKELTEHERAELGVRAAKRFPLIA
jgi:uncharacterized protein (TIGR03083 family)